MARPVLKGPLFLGETRSLAPRIEKCLEQYLSPITATSVLVWVCSKLGLHAADLDTLQEGVLMAPLEQALSIYLTDPQKQQALADVRRVLVGRGQPAEAAASATIPLVNEADVTLARSTALRVALGAGMVKPDAVKVSTVVSELARNILQYAGSGYVDLRVVESPRRAVEIVASDRGPGIPNVREILEGRYRSRTGMGVGLLGSRRLVDEFEVASEPGKGTTVTAMKYV